MKRGDDTWTEIGARRIAKQLRDFWRKKGYDVSCWIVKAEGGTAFDGRPRYDVRSDLFNGWPQRRYSTGNLLAA